MGEGLSLSGFSLIKHSAPRALSLAALTRGLPKEQQLERSTGLAIPQAHRRPGAPSEGKPQLGMWEALRSVSHACT